MDKQRNNSMESIFLLQWDLLLVTVDLIRVDVLTHAIRTVDRVSLVGKVCAGREKGPLINHGFRRRRDIL